ncbi:hypothetical protein K469DRAFT_743791 [Zopfia rhizophila CBS 207.26]|uniref:Apple domain-containing protein n=1 Tax=Zopfia rhizophila CBS 207.26 TaxID=1314779 RepID=A0A6A6EUA9_9PEZI|nr:hypothetical protein K469DRAFT_743791 [Zopfia rhizophila CBS 207.26]
MRRTSKGPVHPAPTAIKSHYVNYIAVKMKKVYQIKTKTKALKPGTRSKPILDSLVLLPSPQGETLTVEPSLGFIPAASAGSIPFLPKLPVLLEDRAQSSKPEPVGEEEHAKVLTRRDIKHYRTHFHPYRYPTAVKCTSYFKKKKFTKTITSARRYKTTTTLIAITTTKTSTTVTISTSTVPAPLFYTTTTETVTSTQTVESAPTTTYYAACGPDDQRLTSWVFPLNNVINVDFRFPKGITPYECCVLCLQHPQCGGSWTIFGYVCNGGAFADTCDPSVTILELRDGEPGPGMIASSSNCGKAQVAFVVTPGSRDTHQYL